MAAAARVHRRDQLDIGGKGDVRVGARDIDLARFERLAQRIEHRALELRHYVADAVRLLHNAVELGQFVEEQHP